MIKISKSVSFDTPYERSCTALEDPDQFGNFLGLDSEGRESYFGVDMVIAAEES
jgi:hypothetical protein